MWPERLVGNEARRSLAFGQLRRRKHGLFVVLLGCLSTVCLGLGACSAAFKFHLGACRLFVQGLLLEPSRTKHPASFFWCIHLVDRDN